MTAFTHPRLAAASLLALGLGASGAAAQTAFEEAFEINRDGATLGIVATLPSGVQRGTMFGDLVLSYAPDDRAGFVVRFYRADSNDTANLLRDSSFDSYWHQRTPIERSEGQFAGHEAEFLRVERPGRAGSYDPVSRRRHDGERIVVVLDQCVGLPTRPVVIELGAGWDEPPLTEDPLVAELVSSLELTLPEDLVPCDPGLLDGLQTVQGEIDLSAW